MLTWTSSRLSSNFRPTNPNRITPNRTINHRNCFPTSPYSFYPWFPRNCTVSNFAFNHALSSPIVSLFSITLVLKFFQHTRCVVETNLKLFDNYIYIYIFRLHNRLTHELSQFQLQSFSSSILLFLGIWVESSCQISTEIPEEPEVGWFGIRGRNSGKYKARYKRYFDTAATS